MRFIDYEKIKKKIVDISNENEIMLVLKDDAYGFGIEKMVLLSMDVVNFYAVKNIEEAIKIRKINSKVDILILGKINYGFNLLKKYNLIASINDYDDYLLFKNNGIRCHLGIDLGMNRFGMKRGYLAIINDPIVEAIYTHLYDEVKVGDEIKFIEELANKYNKKFHIGGSLVFTRTSGMMRIGKIIYEGATSLYKEIVNIKTIEPGETVGYNSSYQSENYEKIGICDFGYADGLDFFYDGKVRIKDKFYDVIGRCCMDQCFIRVDDDVNVGDLVEIYGDKISEDEFCEKNNMTKYELFLQIK